ncbi:hypothetical protein E2C01_060840 [Portunus trituberculatus]|uniref:Uncharacterized protein n=1 Tax=Portunus trituberculatus TaxID=210409 RepID=A0A5B7HA49_PORTR|nr:hypothetical protein [Portunus trituberculatus]
MTSEHELHRTVVRGKRRPGAEGRRKALLGRRDAEINPRKNFPDATLASMHALSGICTPSGQQQRNERRSER